MADTVDIFVTVFRSGQRDHAVRGAIDEMSALDAAYVACETYARLLMENPPAAERFRQAVGAWSGLPET